MITLLTTALFMTITLVLKIIYMYSSFSCIHSEYGKRALTFKASQLWNKLPQRLKDIASITIFEKELRTFLFNNDV